MAQEGKGWIYTLTNGHLEEVLTDNVVETSIYAKQIERVPPLNMHYDTPRSPTGKQWTDQSLLTYQSVNDYLAESGAFQQASFANIIQKWKNHERNQANRLISSFDSHYNMKHRFHHDENLNRSSEMKYGSGAKYYRFIGNEKNPKNVKPCGLHKRRTQEYEERHIRQLLQLPSKTKSRSRPYFLPKITTLSSNVSTNDNLSTVRSSVFDAEASRDTFS